MKKELTTRVFAQHESLEVAHLVVDHDPETARTVALVPRDEAAADAGVIALVERLRSLPGSIRSALRRAGDSAAYLSDDRLQGLAELIQNADDLGATEATIAVDSRRSRLLFSHNGASLTLHDVWALAIPWLSLKVADDEKLGRFGIGLKTLHALSDVIEVYQGHFRIRFSSSTIEPLESNIGWPLADSKITTFAVPFTPGAVRSDDAATWLRQWDDAGLVFLRHLSTVRLIDENKQEILRLQLQFGLQDVIDLYGGRASRRRITAVDGRQWLVYRRNVVSPNKAERVGKTQGVRTPLALAFALFQGQRGYIHVGLPVRAVGLPFRLLAQFDPQPSRRDIADTEWNLALVPMLSALWRDAALDLFQLAPEHAWSAIPMKEEFEADDRTTGRFRASLEEHLLERAREDFAAALMLDDSGTAYSLSDLSYEAAELTPVVSPNDIRLVSKKPGVITEAARSADDRWRKVLDDLRRQGCATPTLLTVQDASVLLDDEQRTPQFLADLLAVAIKAGTGDNVAGRHCLVLHDGLRIAPSNCTDLAVLIPPHSGTMWELLKIGAHLHPSFTAQAGWPTIGDWLREKGWLRSSATNRDALAALADAGMAGTTLDIPLTNLQVAELRRALEEVPDPERHKLGNGVGRAVKVDAFTYATGGERKSIHARPSDAYFIEREANSWFSAAGRAPGLVWIDRRYSERIRTDGSRDAIGAQRLFRLLGAEVAPRVKSHPANERRFVYYPEGVPIWATESPSRRNRILKQHQATYTVQDWIAPDLDAVLRDIAKEQNHAKRDRRAAAVLATLTRAWDRLVDRSNVQAASENRGWVDRGMIDAWWILSAASISWLPAETGDARAPDQLRIKSSANVALYGDDRRRYLGAALRTETYRAILARIGVAGDPTVMELIQKLEEVRSEGSSTPQIAEDMAAPLYQALAAQVRGQRLGDQTASAARSAFSRGDGLIATRNGWRRPSVVFAGPPIFGDMRDFVPSVSGTDPLWALLGITQPTAADARNLLGDLARKKFLTPNDKLIMLEALRRLVGAPESITKNLRKAAVWVGDRWERGRPVYATRNPLIAEALSGRVPIWSPGGSLSQLEPVVDAYKLTRLDTQAVRVLAATSATYDPDLTQDFGSAVANLRADLAMSDPAAEQRLRISWDELSSLRVQRLPSLSLRLVEPSHHLDETVEVDAWLDPTAGSFYIRHEEAIGSPSSGAYAMAAIFDGDSRRIAHDWVAAWSAAMEGRREEEVTTATRLDAERKRERDAKSETRLRDLAKQSKDRRPGPKGAAEPKRNETGPKATTPIAPPRLTRHLVDPDSLTIRNEDGEIVGGTSLDFPVPTANESTNTTNTTRSPDTANPKKPSSKGPGTKNYTEEERESVGLDLARRVLGGSENEIVDIRHQHNVGADAVDDLMNFFELKVYAGPIPETISFTASEFRRAKETEAFFLVVVGNVEQSDKEPELRIITDPLSHLTVIPQGSVNLGGVRSAKALRYTFGP